MRGDPPDQIKAESKGLGLHAVQIAGGEPCAIAEAARRAQDLGASMIAINMGFPAIAAVTLKMHLGWDEQSINAPELARLAEAEGIAMLSVHGCTRCQFCATTADWSIPVAANGDCQSLADAGAMLAQSGADAAMIGRAAMGQPWFVGDVAYYLCHGKARATPVIRAKKRGARTFRDLARNSWNRPGFAPCA